MGDVLTTADLRRPLLPGWKLEVGIDTGTYMSCVFALFPPDAPEAFVVYERPNYRYVGGEIELLGDSIPEWSRDVLTEYRKYRPDASRVSCWCDENSQFKTELLNYNIHARGNRRGIELRVEISREYFNNKRVHLAPWLSVLPWELEHAQWPPESSSAGRFARLKEDDHTLDGIEHILSRRPKHASMVLGHKETFVERHLRLHRRTDVNPPYDPHLGRQ